MRYLSKFNESSSEDINEYINDIFISLIDIGYRVNIEHAHSGIFSINIDKYENRFNISDVRDELLRCVNFLEDEDIILRDIILVTEGRPYVGVYRGNEVKEIIHQLYAMKWSSKFFKIKKVKLIFISKEFSVPKSFTL